MQTLRVRQVPWTNPVGIGLREALHAESCRGRVPSAPTAADDDGTRVAVFLIAYELATGQPVGCGGLRLVGASRADVDYIYVLPYARWSGVSKAITEELTAWARAHGIAAVGPDGALAELAALRL
ncbi:GNAT family N-acetyltransferase [Arthrobacter agilis]|uniref:GNAT family N-acetyltransferase n=1 Tax=Arthrobacter agilis TaxID=37921 RepID=UPI0023654299|nr:GNAT family N-acetyltransferase [Arthrobacter agilis]WDF33307.1 GNAT family N-acetyltransferase [Arthrobacter agilis]